MRKLMEDVSPHRSITFPAYALPDDILAAIAKHLHQLTLDLKQEGMDTREADVAYQQVVEELTRRNGPAEDYGSPNTEPGTKH